MEMPQLGQLAILMAVITPCFPSMSLIHLTVFFPLCCNPSILIKAELNDQQWLGAGAHPSQHMAEEKPPVAFIYGLTPRNLPEHAFSCANSLSETQEYVYRCKTLSLIFDTQQVMGSLHLDVADRLLKK